VGRLIDRRPLEVLFSLFCAAVLLVGLVVFLNARSHPAATAATASRPAKPFDPDAQFGRRIPVPRGAVSTARAFIATAVFRRHLERSWPLLAPAYKHAFTRAQWLRGDIPVVPFPKKGFEGARFKVVRSRAHDVLFEVLLLSRARGAAVTGGQIFFIGLEPGGRGWLVHYWGPKGSNPPIPAAP